MDLLGRVRVRIPKDTVNGELLEEYINTVSDRLCLRIGAESLPDIFGSVCVDAVVKMFRRMYYEGISSEGVTNLSTSFVEDILDEYAAEIENYKEQQANSGKGNSKVVKFL